MKIRALLLLLVATYNLAISQEEKKDPASIMKGLRLMMLQSDPMEAELKKEEIGGNAFGVVMDMPIGGDHTATITSFVTGDASLYTTSTFGVMGGVGHEPVRREARDFVKEAERYLKSGVLVTDFPYPDSETVFFYILTFDGVYKVEAKMKDIEESKTPLRSLYGAGQEVLTQIRLTTQKEG